MGDLELLDLVDGGGCCCWLGDRLTTRDTVSVSVVIPPPPPLPLLWAVLAAAAAASLLLRRGSISSLWLLRLRVNRLEAVVESPDVIVVVGVDRFTMVTLILGPTSNAFFAAALLSADAQRVGLL